MFFFIILMERCKTVDFGYNIMRAGEIPHNKNQSSERRIGTMPEECGLLPFRGNGKEVTSMYMINNNQNWSVQLAEDVNAPELRNPRHSAIRAQGWFARLFKKA